MTATEKTEPNNGAEILKPASSDVDAETAEFLGRLRRWWHRHLEPEERRRVMTDLALINTDQWTWRFTVMLTLSVVISTMGLHANSAAVVIGAMLLAPLMTPVLGLAASLPMALPQKALRSAIRVALATGWCVVLGYFLSMLLPDAELPAEVISRTAPDLRDLAVALAAGAAGSYATVRKDASAALPGVAVAVALVPPLAVVGITLEAGRMVMARGALLLYATNLAAIVMVGVAVFVVTGFVPPRRLARSKARVIIAGLATVIAVGAVATPLVRASLSSAQQIDLDRKATEAVKVWKNGRDLELVQARVGANNVVSVELRGLDLPPDGQLLQSELERRLAGSVPPPNIQFVRTVRPTSSTTSPPTTELSDEDRLRQELTAVVQDWLKNRSDSNDVDLDFVEFDGTKLRVDASGAGEAPDANELRTLLEPVVETEDLALRLNWTSREAIESGGGIEISPERTQERLMTVAERWAESSAVDLSQFDFSEELLQIELTGTSQPEISELVQQLEATSEAVPEIEVYFVERKLLPTTTTTTTP